MRKALRRIEGSASAWLRGTTQGALLQWKRAIEILRMEGKARQAQQQAAQVLAFCHTTLPYSNRLHLFHLPVIL